MSCNFLCEQVRAWLAATASPTPPPATLVAHVAECPRCRGALALLLAGQLNAPLDPDDSGNCNSCQDDLAAFVDLEYAHGAMVAAQTYPQVWWHIWLCPDCAETYRLTRVLVEAEADGALQGSRWPAAALQARPRLPQLRFQRAFLSQVFATQQLLGIAWGADDEGVVLGESASGGYHLSLSVQPLDDEQCIVSVSVEPPFDGWLVLQLGEQVFRARFDDTGLAQIASVPLRMLSAPDGPELMVTIEPFEGQHAAE